MFGFRLKAKSEHEAAQVLSWYDDGTAQIRRIRHLRASCVEAILRIPIRDGRIQSRCSTSKIAMRLRHPGSHGGKGYFLSVRSETNLARSKKALGGAAQEPLTVFSQMENCR